MLYRFVYRYVTNSDDTYDVLQDSFVATWCALARYDPQRPFPAWLRRIALNKCHDRARLMAVRVAAIVALPRSLKEPLILTALGGLLPCDAGALLGLSAKAIETRVYRAKKQLTETLEQQSVQRSGWQMTPVYRTGS